MVEHRILTDEELEEHDRQQDLDYLTALAVQPSSRPLSATAALILAMDGPRRSDLHDCRMTFPFPRAFPMAWLFVCDCGYETTDQHEALAHGQRPQPPPTPQTDQ